MDQIGQSPTHSDNRSWWNKFLQNPVTVKELRGRMRGRRAFVVLTTYLLLMSGFITMVYFLYALAADNPSGVNGRQAGKVVFTAVLAVETFLVVFIGPAFTMAAISGERDRQTYDLLRTTLLSANSLVFGKLLSALSYVFLLLITAIPLQSIAFLLGGISLIEVVLSQILLFISAVTFALIGLFFSSLMRTTLASSVITFSITLLLVAGPPVVAFIITIFAGPFLFGVSSPSWTFQLVLVYGGLLLAATNFPATLIVSDIFLLEQDALFIFPEVIDGHTVYLFSPWFIYLALYVLLALLLYWGSVRRVRRIADR
jgi:ABC-type transport system involved in multi-copper enzyme maturation permease subunit